MTKSQPRGALSPTPSSDERTMCQHPSIRRTAPRRNDYPCITAQSAALPQCSRPQNFGSCSPPIHFSGCQAIGRIPAWLVKRRTAAAAVVPLPLQTRESMEASGEGGSKVSGDVCLVTREGFCLHLGEAGAALHATLFCLIGGFVCIETWFEQDLFAVWPVEYYHRVLEAMLLLTDCLKAAWCCFLRVER